MRKSYYGALILLLTACGCRAEISDAELAADCAKIPGYAKQGEQFYKAKNYPKAREAFEQQVAWQEQCDANVQEFDEDKLATAYNNVALTWIREGEYRKAQAWLSISPDNKKSAYNLALIKDKLDALPKPTSPAGEYWQYAGRGIFQTFVLKPQGGDNWQADWEGAYFGLMAMYSGPNSGEFSEKVTLKEGKGAIVIKDFDRQCTISLAISPDGRKLEAKTDNNDNCGFGYNVSASGTYLRVN